MKKNDNYLTAADKKMITLIDKITAMINERRKVVNIGDAGELLLKDISETRRIVIEYAADRFKKEQELKNPSLTYEEKNKLIRVMKQGKAVEEATKNSYTGLEVMYYQLLNQTDKLPEA